MAVRFYLVQNRSGSGPSAAFLARSVAQGTVTDVDLIEEICASSVFASSEALALLARYHARLAEKVCEGYNVVTPTAVFRPVVRGVFDRWEERFTAAKHEVAVAVAPSHPLRLRAGRKARAERIDPPDSGPCVSRPLLRGLQETDTVCPGEWYVLAGSRLRFDVQRGESLALVSQNAACEVPVTIVPLPRRSRGLVVQMPADLMPGSYRLVARLYLRRQSLSTREIGPVLHCHAEATPDAVDRPDRPVR